VVDSEDIDLCFFRSQLKPYVVLYGIKQPRRRLDTVRNFGERWRIAVE
jgi:hypothetical protein